MATPTTSDGQGCKALPGRRALFAWSLLVLVMTPTASRAQEPQWQFGSAPTLSSGTYGTDARTEVLHTPFTARRLFDDGDVSVVVPFMCVWGDGAVTIVNGSPVRQERLASASTGVRGGRASAEPASDRSCGFGDVVVRGRYYLIDERGWTPTVAVRGHVKAPTASAGRGFGTGRFDEGMGVEIGRTIGATTAMVDGGYTFIGEPAGVDYNNNWWYDVGLAQDLGRNVVKGGIDLSVFFEEYGSIVPGFVNARDVVTAVTVTGASGWRIQVSGEFGLSDGAPDHGITLGASRRF